MTQIAANPFAEWLRQRRRSLDLTQAELARRVGCSTVLIAKFEAGERRPSKQIAALLAEQLELPAHERAPFVQFARSLGQSPGPYAAPSTSPATPLTPPTAEFGQGPPGASASGVAPLSPPGLPAPGTRLIGREPELERIAVLLNRPESRLVTISGPGGVGKTRLAIEAARRVAPDSAYFVALAPVESPELVGQTIALALGQQLTPAADPAIALAALLAGHELLLVLDNLEHLLGDDPNRVDPTAELISALLRGAPGLRLLVTSRERLSLSGEWVIDLDGLGSAGQGAAAGAELFVESARRLRAGFSPQGADLQAIGQIVAAVGGLPLAIELAAGWIEALGPVEIAAELARSLDILATQARDLPGRHRSMRAVFDHSWMMLRAEERAALAGLALFRAPLTREAAGYVARADLAIIAALVQKSLLRRAGGSRYDLHPLVRRFSRERLAASPTAAEATRRFADYYLALAAQGSEAIGGAKQLAWLDTLSAEHDNLRAALELAYRQGEFERGARLCVALLRFWKLRGHYREGLSWAERFLAAPSLAGALRADLLLWAGRFAGSLDDWPRAMALAEQSLTLHRAGGDPASLAYALLALGEAENDMLAFAQSRAHLEEALALFSQIGDSVGRSAARTALANVAYDMGDPALARSLHAEALVEDRARGDQNAEGITLANLGLIGVLEGDAPTALHDCIAATRIFRQVGNRAGLAFCLAGLAALAGQEGRSASAAQLLGAADALRAELQLPISPANRPHFARLDELARAGQEPAAFAAARAAARTLPLDAALDLALG